jgi:branched-chain amino acid transport system ATP-binding protein
MANDTCIEFDDVVAGYKDFMILNNLSFKVRRGSITLLLGPNGAGKSTVLKTLFGLLKLRQGRILLDGVDISGASQKELLARGIAFVPQGRNLFGQLTVFQNLELGGITLGTKTTHERIPEVLEFFPRVKERLHSRPRRCRAASRSSSKSAARCCCAQGAADRRALHRPVAHGGAGRVQAAAKAGGPGHDRADGGAERQERAEDLDDAIALESGQLVLHKPAASCWPTPTSNACSWAAAMCRARPWHRPPRKPLELEPLNRRTP